MPGCSQKVTGCSDRRVCETSSIPSLCPQSVSLVWLNPEKGADLGGEFCALIQHGKGF